MKYISEEEKKVRERHNAEKNKALFKQGDLKNEQQSIGQFYTFIRIPVTNSFTTELKRKISK